MEHLPDHVLDWKLEVYVDEKSTIQTRYISDPAKGLWRSRVQETWQRTRRLGRGAFGVVNLEECASGPSQGQLRAVKELHKGTVTPLVYYSRELEAIVKFSHERVNLS
jgi:calcium/calmodulin-dependent protein kinase I